jgi:hypothetical protein
MSSRLAQKVQTVPKGEVPSRSEEFAHSAETELLQRIVAAPAFRRSTLLTNFLVYICDRKINGRDEEITEYQIGVQALGRPSSYSPGEDNIVRNYARMLRKRLEEYFAREGQEEALRIVIPVGHYVPIFEPNVAVPERISEVNSAPAVSTGSSNTEPSPMMPGNRRWRWIWLTAASLIVAAITLPLYWSMHRAAHVNLNEVFWRQVFEKNRATYLVPGDSGLAMMQEITGKEVHLSDYVAGDLDKRFHDFNLAAARKGEEYGFDRVSDFTSKADLSIATRVARLAQLYGGQLKVCYPRYMNMDNFKDSIAILVGGPRANPWVEMFEPESNFRMIFPTGPDGIRFYARNFVNKHPQAGEQANYWSEANDFGSRSYALISFLPDANNSGHVLMLQGQGMGGTQAAGDFLLDPYDMEPVLRKAKTAGGSIGPFEILIDARTVGTNEVQSRIVAERFAVAKNPE